MTRGWQRLYDFNSGVGTGNVIAGVSNNDLAISLRNGAVEIALFSLTGYTTNTNTWFHTCIGMSGRRVVVWYNSQVIYDNAALMSATKTTVAFTSSYIGKSPWPDQAWGGAFDEFRIYNRLLTTAEVATVYSFSGDGDTPVMAQPCSVCAAGTYFVTACNATVDTACVACPSGKYCLGGGSSACCMHGNLFCGELQNDYVCGVGRCNVQCMPCEFVLQWERNDCACWDNKPPDWAVLSFVLLGRGHCIFWV